MLLVGGLLPHPAGRADARGRPAAPGGHRRAPQARRRAGRRSPGARPTPAPSRSPPTPPPRPSSRPWSPAPGARRSRGRQGSRPRWRRPPPARRRPRLRGPGPPRPGGRRTRPVPARRRRGAPTAAGACPAPARTATPGPRRTVRPAATVRAGDPAGGATRSCSPEPPSPRWRRPARSPCSPWVGEATTTPTSATPPPRRRPRRRPTPRRAPVVELPPDIPRGAPARRLDDRLHAGRRHVLERVAGRVRRLEPPGAHPREPRQGAACR